MNILNNDNYYLSPANVAFTAFLQTRASIILFYVTQNASATSNEHRPKKLKGQEIKRSPLKLTAENARVKHEISKVHEQVV